MWFNGSKSIVHFVNWILIRKQTTPNIWGVGVGGPISKESSILLHNVIKAWARVLLANRLKSQRVKTRIIFQEKIWTEVSNNQPCVLLEVQKWNSGRNYRTLLFSKAAGMLTTFNPSSQTPRWPLLSHSESRGKEDLCNKIWDRGWGYLGTVREEGEVLYGAIQCHAGLLHFVPEDNSVMISSLNVSYRFYIFVSGKHRHTHQSEVETV